ncbi:PREDICTED: leucine-rich repeat neuronal protein 4 [Condylura cristata]|uniref:leucine-rich repeat neuronal protein 4 n=1 Tax=Condylura cristata TaxID=143302 RepID=UPI0003347387|nr:PREDICTED: leucine-rich repeat neuronal protein 4 [Condylura cristata]
MRWVLLLSLLMLPRALRRSRAGLLLEKAPIFRLIQQGPWPSGPSNTTMAPCEGLLAAGTEVFSPINRSLERLPSCLPRSLRSLDGSHNLLRALSAQELGRLPELQVLTLRHNHIASLHWGPGGPAGLHTLDLSYNQLTALPQCAGPERSRLRVLTLTGNPLQGLQPGAFSCFPELQLLNLSSTALGLGAQAGIADAAFTGAGGAPLAQLEVLDLSSTFLTQVSGWIRDLPKLTSLYLRKMPRLRSLEGDIFKMSPELQQLDCQDSPALTSVHTPIFQDTPHLQQLLFQNCNLSSFPPWTLHSSQVLSINLFGNPLTCSCELSWLFKDTKTILSRAAETECKPAIGSSATFSTPLWLSQLPGVCPLDTGITLPHSPSVSSTHAPYTQVPTALAAAASTSQPARVHSSPGAARLLDSVGELITSSPSSQEATSSKASTAWTERQENVDLLVLEPNVSAASIPWASKHLGLFPASRNPVSAPQLGQRTRASLQAPHASPTQGEIPVLMLDDSSEEEEEEEGEKVGALAQGVPCDYHPCKHLQTPCGELQRRSKCLCPGLSREDTLPDPPKLQGVSETTDTSALISWCAPNSVVQGYQIHYAPTGWPGNQSVVGDIYATARQHPLYGLEPGTTYLVCVLAANRAGLSPSGAEGWGGACATFTTKPSFVLIFGGLCAASGLLLVSTLLLTVCLCRRSPWSRRQRYDTHLVDYKNPAFDYPLKLQTLNLPSNP